MDIDVRARLHQSHRYTDPGVIQKLFSIVKIPQRFVTKVHFLSVWLSETNSSVEPEHQVRWQKLLQLCRCVSNMCTRSTKSNIELINRALGDIAAREVEGAMKARRKETKAFQSSAKELYMTTAKTPSNVGLQRFLSSHPAIKVGVEALNQAKITLERLDERDIDVKEILAIHLSGIHLSPTQLLHMRKKDVLIQTHVTMIKQLQDYCAIMQRLQSLAFQRGRASDSELFMLQYKNLPSYARRHVLFGYPLIAGQPSE